jgi:hypothetical protein
MYVAPSRYLDPKATEVNEELRDLYPSPSVNGLIKSRMMKWAGHVARMAEKRNVYRLFVGKSDRKRPLGRPRRRGIDKIKMDLAEIAWSAVDWITRTFVTCTLPQV